MPSLHHLPLPCRFLHLEPCPWIRLLSLCWVSPLGVDQDQAQSPGLVPELHLHSHLLQLPTSFAHQQPQAVNFYRDSSLFLNFCRPHYLECCVVAQSCLSLCDPMDCSPPGSSAHGISKARILEWVAVSFSTGSSRLRDQTPISCLEHPLLFLENFLLTPWDPPRVSPALGSLSWSPTGGASCLSMCSHCVLVCLSLSSHHCIVRSYLSLSPGDCKLLKGLCLLPQHTPHTQHRLYTQQTCTCSKNAVFEDPAILCNVTGHSKGKTFLIQKASTCLWI